MFKKNNELSRNRTSYKIIEDFADCIIGPHSTGVTGFAIDNHNHHLV